MKRTVLVVMILLLSGVSVFSQKIANESYLYPKTFQIRRIYTHPLGYRVDYLKQDYSIGTLWAPIEWFRTAANIGELAYTSGPATPFITFFFKEGVLDHFSIYAFANPLHPSWALLDAGTDYTQDFPSPDTIPEIDF